jgi:hypothetical protein
MLLSQSVEARGSVVVKALRSPKRLKSARSLHSLLQR